MVTLTANVSNEFGFRHFKFFLSFSRIRYGSEKGYTRSPPRRSASFDRIWWVGVFRLIGFWNRREGATWVPFTTGSADRGPGQYCKGKRSASPIHCLFPRRRRSVMHVRSVKNEQKRRARGTREHEFLRREKRSTTDCLFIFHVRVEITIVLLILTWTAATQFPRGHDGRPDFSIFICPLFIHTCVFHYCFIINTFVWQ